MRGVCLKIGTVAILGRLYWRACQLIALADTNGVITTDLVQIIILSNQLLQLRLDINNLLRRELKLDHGNASFLEMLEESNFRRLQEHQTAALAVRSTGRASNSVDIVSWVIRRIELDNPVDSGDLSRG